MEGWNTDPGERRRRWAKHWQCNEEVQNAKDKPWKNEKLRKLDKALPRLKEGDLEKASRMKAKTGGCDGFHPKVLLDLTKETSYCGILGDGGAEWQIPATGLHNDVLSDPEGCHE